MSPLPPVPHHGWLGHAAQAEARHAKRRRRRGPAAPQARQHVRHRQGDHQEWLAAKGFGPDRVFGPKAGTNAGTKYENKRCGNGPELMPLDNDLFAYFSHALNQHVALTGISKPGDPEYDKVFRVGNRPDLESAFERTWEVSPTLDEVARDSLRFLKGLDAVIKAKGGVVQEVQRRGRRARPRKYKKFDPSKAKKAFVHHPDCDAAIAKQEAVWSTY